MTKQAEALHSNVSFKEKSAFEVTLKLPPEQLATTRIQDSIKYPTVLTADIILWWVAIYLGLFWSLLYKIVAFVNVY